MARTAEKKGKASRWTVVVSLTFVVALAVASLVLWLSRPGRSPQPPQQVPGGEATSPGLLAHLAEAPTARQLYPAAAKVAQSWQPDARVAAVSAHWRPERGRWSADVTWTFQFYSPVTRRVAVIIVEGGRAQLLRESVAPYRLAILDEADWQVDSDAALDAWWRAGGGTLVSIHPETDLVAQLRVLQGDGDRLAWTVTGVSGNQVRRLIIDGTTGEQIQD